MYPHGTNKAIMDSLAKLEGIPSMTYGLVGDIAAAMDRAVTGFEKNTNIKLSALVSLCDNDFGNQKVALHEAIDTAVRNRKQIIAKHKAAQAYEMRCPGVSYGRCMQVTKQLFEQNLADTERPSSIPDFVLNGVRHIYL
jgi:hypothetical protein